MLDISMLIWLVAIAAGLTLFWAPVIIAVIRDVDKVGAVVLLTILTLATGVAWPVALCMAFMLPRADRPSPAAAAWRPSPAAAAWRP